MKITMINAEKLPVPPVLGGAVAQTLFETAVAIQKPKLTVISPWADALENTEVEPSKTFYHVNIKAQKALVKDILGNRRPVSLKHPKTARYFYYLNGVTDLLQEIEPDIIQVHNRLEFVPYLLRQFPNKKFVLYMHNEPDYSDARFRDAVQGIDRLIFVSHYLANRFAHHYPEAGSKSEVIHNSVDTHVWRPNLIDAPETEKIRLTYGLSPGNTVLFVGRTAFVKGTHCLLDAMDIVRRARPDAKLLVVGSPFFGAVQSDPYLRRLEDRARELGDTVVFTGYIDRTRTPYFYAAADLVTIPSIFHDPFPKVVLETMASGTPLVGSRRGGIPEMVEHGTHGLLLADPKKVAHLAHCILTLLKDAKRRKKMGANARTKAEACFRKSIRLKRIQKFYKSF